MKLSMLSIVNRTAAAREQVRTDIDIVENDLFDITLAGRFQDDAMKAAVKAAVLTELRGREASLARDLESYGVAIG